MRSSLTSLLIIISLVSVSQTFTGAGGFVPGTNSFITFSVNVSGLSPSAIDTIGFGVEKITININHPNTSDLVIRLDAPDGTIIMLSSNNGGTGNNYSNTVFRDTADVSINNASAPFSGYYKPAQRMALLNNGQNGNGIWRLRIKDMTGANSGNLVSWSITFGTNPCGKLNFYSSNLPIVHINSLGQNIPYNNKVSGLMKIIDNGPGFRNYLSDTLTAPDRNIGIEIHGQTSSGFPQQSYNIETRDALGNNLDTSILGMPKENDWVLYGPYDDKTFMRNALVYELSREMGRWAARTKLCEVVLNNTYMGVYTFIEKIKRDSMRVDIAKLTPTDIAGDSLTGGYIFSIDKGNTQWTSPYLPNFNTGTETINFQYIYPKPTAIAPQQGTYLQAYVDSFETALNGANFQDPITGYRKYANVKSFVDYFLLNELSRNVDGYRLSSYFYKDKYSKGGQLNAGPLWDFNLSFGNADYCNGELTNGWAFQFNSYCGSYWLVPFWWDKMVLDSAFSQKLYCRWNTLKTSTLDTTHIFHLIDSMAAQVWEAKTRHYTKWTILGQYTWPNPSPLPDDYPEEISVMKTWIKNRLAWMDANMYGTGPCSFTTRTDLYVKPIAYAEVFPNPFTSNFKLKFGLANRGDCKIELFDNTGQLLAKLFEGNLNSGMQTKEFEISSTLPKGMYLIKISSQGNQSYLKLIRE